MSSTNRGPESYAAFREVVRAAYGVKGIHLNDEQLDEKLLELKAKAEVLMSEELEEG